MEVIKYQDAYDIMLHLVIDHSIGEFKTLQVYEDQLKAAVFDLEDAETKIKEWVSLVEDMKSTIEEVQTTVDVPEPIHFAERKYEEVVRLLVLEKGEVSHYLFSIADVRSLTDTQLPPDEYIVTGTVLYSDDVKIEQLRYVPSEVGYRVTFSRPIREDAVIRVLIQVYWMQDCLKRS